MKLKSYAVGYGKPPRHSRFKPGQSGNPKGRPKGARGFRAELKEELKETLAVTENGRTRKLTKQRAIIKAQFAKAIRGDTKSFAEIVKNSDVLREGEGLQVSELDAIDKLIIEEFRRQLMEGNENDQ